MAEVAGLVLGGTSLAFELFAGCVKGFVLLSTAHNLGKDGTTLLCMLNLQELQLTEWARRAGLLNEPPILDKRLNEAVVCQVLKALEDLLINVEKLKSRYKLGLVVKGVQTNQETNTISSPLLNVIGGAISDDLRGDILYRARLIQSRNHFPQRLWWAAVDKEKFSELIDTIRAFVKELWNLYDPVRQDAMFEHLQLILSHIVKMTDRIDQLSSLQETLHGSMIIQTSSKSQPNASTLASVAMMKTVRLRDATRLSSTAPTTTDLSNLGGQTPDILNSAGLTFDMRFLDDFEPLKGNREMGIARYQKEVVFVEWKTLPVQSRSKIMARVQELASFLSTVQNQGILAFRCRGVAVDTEAAKAAFVFELPAMASSSADGSSPPSIRSPPLPLRHSFNLTPSVTDRIQLALQITQAVKNFHTAGWLHKDLRSENIILLTSEYSGVPGSSLLHRPILAGFAFARLDSPSQISEQPSSNPERDLYRHPHAMGEPSTSFSAPMDIYSLGTILLEIGEWRSMKSLVAKIVDIQKANVPTTELAKVKLFLLDNKPQSGLSTLEFRMGNVYAAVTRMMLSGEIPQMFESNKSDFLALRPDLLDVAIRELSQCVI